MLSRAHRIETSRPGAHVRVSLRGELLADSRDPVLLQEGALPPRWYVPRSDVRAELMASDTRTTCPFKGEAVYFSVRPPDGTLERDIAWYYPDPLPDVAEIADLVCFYAERTEVEVEEEG